MRTPFFPRNYWGFSGAVVAIVGTTYALWGRGEAALRSPLTTPSYSLDELCQDSFREGWRIRHPPDLPGPYRRREPGFFYYHPGDARNSCTVTCRDAAGAVVWEERTRPGVDFLTLVLETADGRRATGLLVRGE